LGAILGGTGVAMLSQVSQPWHFILIYGLWVPIGINLGFANPALATVRRWFMKKAGITMALVMTGSGLGIAILLPLSAALIQAVGWRSSYVIMGAMVFVGCIIAAYLYRTSPETEGTYPDGEEPDPEELAARTDFMARMERWSLKEAASVAPFWLVILGQAGILFTFMGLMGHMVTWAAVDLVTPFQKAATLMTAFLLTATVSRLAGGWLSDWTMNKLGWTRKGLLYIGHVGVIGGTIMCATVVESFDMLVLAVAIMGFFYGALMPIFQVWLGDLFGVVSIPSLMGAIGIFTAGFSALGPMLFAWSHGSTGYYDLAFWVCAGLLAFSIICIWLIKPPKKE
jgi:MFS family permease